MNDDVIIGSITDQEKDVILFLDEMSLAAAQLVHLSRLKKGHAPRREHPDPPPPTVRVGVEVGVRVGIRKKWLVVVGEVVGFELSVV